MRRGLLEWGTGSVLLLFALYCLGDVGSIAAVLLPILAHELGHLLALWLLRLPVRGFRVELRGLCIEYGGGAGPLSQAFAALAGPLAGLCYAFVLASLAGRLGGDWCSLTAGVSLLLSLFNLLPALPLDGGTVLLALVSLLFGERAGRLSLELTGLLTAAGLLGLGLYRMTRGEGAALVLAAIWLLLSQENAQGLVKRREIL